MSASTQNEYLPERFAGSMSGGKPLLHGRFGSDWKANRESTPRNDLAPSVAPEELDADPLRPARGIIRAVALGLAMWSVFGVLAWQLI